MEKGYQKSTDTNNTGNSIFNLVSKNIFILFFILWSVRFINLGQPILDGAALRQLMTASVSKFLFMEGISFENILYPRFYAIEPAWYYMVEMPVYNTLMALLCKVYGSHEEWIGRSVSILFSGLAGIYFYLFLINHTSDRIAKIALILYCISPLSIIYTKAIQPNPSMLFFLMATIYYFDKYLTEPRAKTYCMTILFGAILFVLNVSVLTIGLLLLCLAIRKYGARFFVDIKNYFMALCMLIPCLLWIKHVNSFVSANLNNVKVMTGPIVEGRPTPVLSFHWLSDYSFYKAQFQLLSGEILTPIGFGLFVLGLGLLRKKDSVLIFWLISFGIYFILINQMFHPYYYLPWLFPMSWAIAKSISFIYDNFPPESFFKKKIGLSFLTLLTVGIIAGYSNSGFIIPAAVKMVPDAIKTLNKFFPENVYGVISPAHAGALEFYVYRDAGVLEGNSSQEKLDAFKKILKNSEPKYYLSIYPHEDYAGKNEFSSFLRENYPVAEYKENEFVLYKIE